MLVSFSVAASSRKSLVDVFSYLGRERQRLDLCEAI